MQFEKIAMMMQNKYSKNKFMQTRESKIDLNQDNKNKMFEELFVKDEKKKDDFFQYQPTNNKLKIASEKAKSIFNQPEVIIMI